MRSIIIDDEPEARTLLKILLARVCPEVEVVDEAANIQNGIEKIRKTNPDLIFLDIQMPPWSGFDILKAFPLPFPFKVIFISAFEKYAARAFRVSAVDFLVKPVNEDELKEAVQKVRAIDNSAEERQRLKLLLENFSISEDRPERLFLPTVGGFEIREIREILRCQANGSYTEILFVNGTKCLPSKGLGHYERILKDVNFFRCHYSHIVNLKLIRTYRKDGWVVLQGGDTVPVSDRYKQGLLQALEGLGRR